MKTNWVVYTYPYGFYTLPPTSTDSTLPLGYIWIVNETRIAYSLESVTDDGAIWVARAPDIVYNYGTSMQVNIIGDAALLNITKITQPTITIPEGFVISAPGVGEHLVTEIYMDEHNKLVAKFNEVPVI